MIDTYELRQGNYIWTPSQQLAIVADIIGSTIVARSHYGPSLRLDSKTIFPIPIDELWLAGWEATPGMRKGLNVMQFKGDPSIAVHFGSTNYLFVNDSRQEFNELYAHRMQNIYLDLTGGLLQLDPLKRLNGKE
jgi:hypothetical protein